MLTTVLNWLRSRFPGENVGAWAESLAADWLQRERGFRIVTRNWRNPRDRREEIDLVCDDRDVLVFVEVKARDAAALVPGYYAVDKRKKRVLLHAAQAYLARVHPRPRTYRLDIVEVSLPPKGQPKATPQVLHFENVPLFSKYHQ